MPRRPLPTAVFAALVAFGVCAVTAGAARWSPLAASGDGAFAIHCQSTRNCLALAGPSPLHWNGSAWSTTSIPNGSDLNGLACTAPGACVAVGSTNGIPIVERLRAGRWALQRSPNPTPHVPGGSFPNSRLSSVSCPAANWCVAVGRSGVGKEPGHVLIERSGGHRWVIERRPKLSGELDQVSCSSTTNCSAVGPGIALHWNGRTWVFKRPKGPVGGHLGAVSCASEMLCFATGSTGGLQTTPFVERWSGRRWSLMTVALPPGVTGGTLDGIDCRSSRFCMAVGQHTSGGFPSFSGVGALVARWNGKTWRTDALPATSTHVESLNVVTCLSAHWCMAVGDGFAEIYS